MTRAGIRARQRQVLMVRLRSDGKQARALGALQDHETIRVVVWTRAYYHSHPWYSRPEPRS